MKKVILLIACVFVIGLFSGCETIKGLGQDIQNTGDNIWEAINK